MAFDELFANSVTDIIYIECSLLTLHFSVKNNLKKDITQLFAQERFIILIDCLNNLIGFLNQRLFDAFMGLFPVPRATARRTKNLHDSAKVIEVISGFEVEIIHYKYLSECGNQKS